jgi:predicted lipoprotein with Yx(FWY)xxD motif
VIDLAPAGFLVDDGRSLYVFDTDTGPTSSCYDTCANNWPPLLSPNNAPVAPGDGVEGTFTTFQRTDGKGYQVAYNGDPLYFFAADAAPGDTKGDGVGGVWHLAGRAPSASSTPAAATTGPPSVAPASGATSSPKPGSSGACPGYYCDEY